MVFNKSLSEGVVPDDWKVAHVTAIFKKGNVKSPGNYRPVSLTSIVCKLLESIIRDQVMEFLNTNELLSEDQNGFRSGLVCVTDQTCNLSNLCGRCKSLAPEIVSWFLGLCYSRKDFCRAPIDLYS